MLYLNYLKTKHLNLFKMEYKATYGRSKIQCTIFVLDGWYVVEGSVNVNRTRQEFYDGIDVEEIEDYDFFTSSKEIDSLEELENQINL